MQKVLLHNTRSYTISRRRDYGDNLLERSSIILCVEKRLDVLSEFAESSSWSLFSHLRSTSPRILRIKECGPQRTTLATCWMAMYSRVSSEAVLIAMGRIFLEYPGIYEWCLKRLAEAGGLRQVTSKGILHVIVMVRLPDVQVVTWFQR